MAEVDVKKQTGEQQRGQSLERPRQGELQRRGPYSSLLSMNPAELFGVSPFSLMRRFTEEMDRMFQGAGHRREEVALWAPTVEVTGRDGKLEAVAGLPGINAADAKLECADEGPGL